ncbi:AMP-binding protein [Nocardioides sp. AE5]|uniref:class I adenylate-forming enzyme family protein n=1 Tax=Nocardioides sp. AE5 TaxID=2962573 RepID=UPI002880C149|nr:AMP-binding protein [Nocardioides sp. AE5]MDT0202694.1 AMP-binding protein [Nocardioides sp. AE5]
MLLELAAEGDPDRVAVTCAGVDVSYAGLRDRAAQMAGQIASVQSGAVAYLGANSPDAVALMFGSALAGVPYAPINYRWTDAQIAEAVGRIAPVVVVSDSANEQRISFAEQTMPLPAQADPAAVATPAEPEDPGVLLFTSGTSGTPKAAILRHRHLVPYVLETVEFLSADPEEAILVSVPPYHIAAVSSVLTSVYAGRRMVQLEAFTAESWVEVARSESVTQAMVVPTMLNRILDLVEADGHGLPALRHLSYGGGRMPASVVARTMELLPHVDLVNAYGLTETSSTITLLTPADHREAAASDDPAVRARLGSVGKALPSVEIQVRDADGAAVAAGEPGEIWVRGDQVSGEYLSHSAIDADGWYPTRDHGCLDAEGFLFLQGRADDVIVRGGENLSPVEIEERLAAHGTVAEAAVIGVPDTEWGERVEAFVVPAEGAVIDPIELREWVRAELRSTRVPEAIHVRPELPYNETGKLLRRVLRSDLAAVRQ